MNCEGCQTKNCNDCVESKVNKRKPKNIHYGTVNPERISGPGFPIGSQYRWINDQSWEVITIKRNCLNCNKEFDIDDYSRFPGFCCDHCYAIFYGLEEPSW